MALRTAGTSASGAPRVRTTMVSALSAHSHCDSGRYTPFGCSAESETCLTSPVMPMMVRQGPSFPPIRIRCPIGSSSFQNRRANAWLTSATSGAPARSLSSIGRPRRSGIRIVSR